MDESVKFTLEEEQSIVINEDKVLVLETGKEYSVKEVNKGEKVYYTMDGIGSAKYTVNFYDGKKTHRDGSPFYDIRTFKNKKDMLNFIQDLISDGYRERRVGESSSKPKENTIKEGISPDYYAIETRNMHTGIHELWVYDDKKDTNDLISLFSILKDGVEDYYDAQIIYNDISEYLSSDWDSPMEVNFRDKNRDDYYIYDENVIEVMNMSTYDLYESAYRRNKVIKESTESVFYRGKLAKEMTFYISEESVLTLEKDHTYEITEVKLEDLKEDDSKELIDTKESLSEFLEKSEDTIILPVTSDLAIPFSKETVTLEEGKTYSIKETRYSPEFKRALNDVNNTLASAAETLGRRAAMNPEVIYDWAIKHGVDLVQKGYIFAKDPNKLLTLVMYDKPLKEAVFKITFEDGNTLTTKMNASLKQAKDYYLGNEFNFGTTDDKMVKATKVEQIKESVQDTDSEKEV